jgi:ribosome maturation factor RimP
MVGSPDAIRALVEPPLTAAGLELWDVEVTRDAVRVLVDRPGGIDLDALSQLAGKVVSPLLDEHPELTPAGQFSLEVSSPGVERTLRRLDQYVRYVGAEVAIKTGVAVEGSRRHHGLLVSVDEDMVVLAPDDDAEGRTLAIRHDQIERTRTVLDWGPAPKPGSSRAGSKQGRKQTGRTGHGTSSVPTAVKRPAADGRVPADQPVASREKEAE